MLKIEKLSASYGKKQVLFDISAVIERGKFTAIIGRNGSGKSTLLSCIASLHSYSGKITLGGRDISSISRRERAKALSFLPQNLPITPFTVAETVAFGREPYTDLTGKLSDLDKKAVCRAIEQCGIAHLSDKRLSEISGGERQMAYLAMMMAQNAAILLLDEPTTYMDAPNARELLSALTLARDGGKTVVAVMHDLTQAIKYADNVILLESGRPVFSGSRDAILQSGEIERVMGVESHRLADGQYVFL